jgi:hypothetical protein
MRELVRGILAVLFLTFLPSATAQTPARDAVLRDLARDVIAPAYQSLVAQCRELTNAVGQFTQTTNQASLDQARKAWLAAADAANRIRCFQAGPMADSDDAPTFYYPQVTGDSIEGVIADSSHAIDQSRIDEVGANSKGLYAAEYLLFDRRGGQATEPMESAKALDLLSGSERRREYLLAIVRDMETKAGQIADAWIASGDHATAAKFAAGGHVSIDVLVNHLAGSLEALQNRLSFPLMLPNPLSHQLYRIERSRSASSLEGAMAQLEGIQKIYRGSGGLGLGDAVKAVNAPLAKRIDDQFDKAMSAAKAIGEPLEQAAVDKRPAVQNACDQTHALEILFKVDLASALGVTITFTSGDGD